MVESSKRSAHATIRGYLYQTCLGVRRWLDLQPNEILVCEGDEDLDRHILNGESIYEQVKDYSGGLGLADRAVRETLGHFLLRYVDLRKSDRASRFVFTTTARPKRRQADKDFDLLEAWRQGKREEEVLDGVRALFVEDADAAATLAWLDGQPDRWKGFLNAVEWSFDEPDLEKIRSEIRALLARREDTRALPAETLLDRLIVEVLSASSRSDIRDRTFTSQRLSALVQTARETLVAWEATPPVRRVQAVFNEIRDLARLLHDNTSELPPSSSPGKLLTAAYEVIPFDESGRRAELEMLASWCSEKKPERSVLLLTGEGGSGKTRLMIEWCRRLQVQGWHTGFLRGDRSPQDLDPLLEGTTRRLVVIDYAETRLDVVEALLLKMGLTTTGPKLRLVLLARRVGDWWTSLTRVDRSIEDLLAGARQQTISPLVPKPEERQASFLAAREAFANQTGRKAPRDAPPDVTGEDFKRILYLHMAALASLEGERVETAQDALKHALLHEERFWLQVARELGLNKLQTGQVMNAMGPAVALLTLAGGASSEEKALGIFQRALSKQELVEPVLNLLKRLYEGSRERYIDPLQPDILGEQLVSEQLSRHPEILGRFLDGAAPGETRSALTVLTRLAQRRSEYCKWLGIAYRGRLSALAEIGLEVAVETGDPAGIVLADELEQEGNADLAERLVDLCLSNRFEDSVHLREVGLCATEIVLQARKKEWTKPDLNQLGQLARLTGILGYKLSQLGRHEDALQATQQAVNIYRQLAENRPDAFLPDLAASFNNFGNRLSELGQREEALQFTQQAVDIYRQLAKTNDTFRPDLASSLNNLGGMLRELGRPEDAFQATQQAVDIYQQLAETRPDVFRPDLAKSLSNLGIRHNELGRPEDAFQATQQAVDIYRQLTETRPDAFRLKLALSLNSLGLRLSKFGRHEDALQATQQAVDIYKQLNETRPDAFQPDLAMSLNNLSTSLGDLGRREDALQAIQQAIDIYRQLAKNRPDAFRPDLAGSLGNFSKLLRSLGHSNEALVAIDEAFRLLSPYFLRYPDAFRGWMAMMLSDYLNCAEAVGIELDTQLLHPILTLLFPPAESNANTPEDQQAEEP